MTAKERTETGVGFSLSKKITGVLEEEPAPVNDRIMTMRLPLHKKLYATFISAPASKMTNLE